ncbi:MAG: hypothetical protein KKB22_07140, partial [Candidatus Omnitrophica bacterium]|nr:hypothetical protein [Candidatus Omnitrophota bacterium]
HRSKGWKFYFAPDAKVDHMHRADLKALRRVWVTYGQAHANLLNKHLKKSRLEIIFQFLNKNPSISLPFPIKGFIYLGNFHLMHIFGFIFILSLILGLGLASLIAFILTAYFAYQYVKWNIGMEPKKEFFTWYKMKYLTNLSFIQGGLKDFKKYKIICIEPSF